MFSVCRLCQNHLTSPSLEKSCKLAFSFKTVTIQLQNTLKCEDVSTLSFTFCFKEDNFGNPFSINDSWWEKNWVSHFREDADCKLVDAGKNKTTGQCAAKSAYVTTTVHSPQWKKVNLADSGRNVEILDVLWRLSHACHKLAAIYNFNVYVCVCACVQDKLLLFVVALAQTTLHTFVLCAGSHGFGRE